LSSIQDDLLDLVQVGQHGRKVLRQSRVERNVPALLLGSASARPLENDLVQVEELFLRRDLLDPTPERRADHVAGAL